MDALDDALRARIDELAGPNKGRQPILSTTGTQVAIAELIAGMTGSSGSSAN